MRKRGLGLLLILTFALVATALVQAFRFDLSITREQSSAANVDRTIGAIELAIANVRAAQAAYVAAGQSPDFWMNRASELIADVDSRLGGLRSTTSSPVARPHYEVALSALGSLTEQDRKVRTDVSENEQLVASDVIFMDSLEIGRRLEAELKAARDAETADSAARIAALRRWQLGLNGGAIALFMIVAIVIFSRVPSSASAPPAVRRDEPAPTPAALRRDEAAAPPRSLAPPPPRPASPAAQVVRTAARAAPDVNLAGAADVCVDLARVLDARDVPPLLSRAADVLDATGLILWVTNSERTALHPSLSHGYPARILERLGTLAVDADNPTSHAFRSMRTQTVASRSTDAHGAIAVPVITSSGCLGVLAAEIRQSAPSHERLAVARILAAQLATLVTPASASSEAMGQ